MKKKLSIMALSAVMICASFFAFAGEAEPGGGQTATCDSATTSKCVIYNVGEGTGRLVVTQAN